VIGFLNLTCKKRIEAKFKKLKKDLGHLGVKSFIYNFVEHKVKILILKEPT